MAGKIQPAPFGAKKMSLLGLALTGPKVTFCSPHHAEGLTMHDNKPDSQATADAIAEALRPFHELVADGRRLRALNRASWMCDAVCWAGDKAGGYQEPSAENENVAEMIESLDGSDEALDRLRVAIDRMVAADAPDPRQDDLFPTGSQS